MTNNNYKRLCIQYYLQTKINSFIMSDTIISSVILMAISGLTFIAYKHPDAYSKMYKYLFAFHIVVFMSINAWNLGVTITATKLNSLIPADKSAIALKISDGLQTSLPWTFILNFAIMGYLLFLSLLPLLIKKKDNGTV